MALTRAKIRNDMAIRQLECIDLTMANTPESEAETTGNTSKSAVGLLLPHLWYFSIPRQSASSTRFLRLVVRNIHILTVLYWASNFKVQEGFGDLILISSLPVHACPLNWVSFTWPKRSVLKSHLFFSSILIQTNTHSSWTPLTTVI